MEFRISEVEVGSEFVGSWKVARRSSEDRARSELAVAEGVCWTFPSFRPFFEINSKVDFNLCFTVFLFVYFDKTYFHLLKRFFQKFSKFFDVFRV